MDRPTHWHEDSRWEQVDIDVVGLVLAVIQDDLAAFGQLARPYADDTDLLGALLWRMGQLAHTLTNVNLAQSFEAHPDQPPMDAAEFVRSLALKLKMIPPPES